MSTYNSLLLRQMKKSHVNPDEISNPDLLRLLSFVSEHYDGNDEEQALLERSFEISTREYQESIDRIKMLQAQLIHTEKLAGIGQLSAGIAHEINNPLGYVHSNIEILKDYLEKIHAFYLLIVKMHAHSDDLSLDSMKEKCIEINAFIKKANMDYIFEDITDLTNETADGLGRIKTIVKSLLGFTHKGYENQFAPYDLNKGIREALTIANNEIKYHATVVENLDSVPLLNALASEVNQVLLNLIINAGYAIKDKGTMDTMGTITIRTYTDNENTYCEISDDGIGIPAEIIPHIFEPFYTTKPVGIGTGLGLSIVHDIIVSKHKGSVSVSSEIGIGTTFKLALPNSLENDYPE